MICEYPGCSRELKGNPNDKQCDNCTKLYCSAHQRLVEWGIRMCVICKPKAHRRHRAVA